MLPGPVSKAMTSLADAPAGMAVRLAMPPMFCTMRPMRWLAIEQVIEEGNQGRAFASRSHIGGAEIGYHRDAHARGDHRAFARLPGDREFASQKWRGFALMVERLAMASDELDFLAEASLGGQDSFGIQFGEQEIQSGQVGDAGLLCVHGFQHGAADRFGIWVFGMSQEFEDRFVESRAHAGEAPASARP